jgi:hypothetical protein
MVEDLSNMSGQKGVETFSRRGIEGETWYWEDLSLVVIPVELRS